MITVAIDPGKKGGVAVFLHTTLKGTFSIKPRHIYTQGKANFMDVWEFCGDLSKLIGSDAMGRKIRFIIEAQQPHPTDTPTTAFAIGTLYASLIETVTRQFQGSELFLVSPSSWQAVIRRHTDGVFLTSKHTSIHFAKTKHGENVLIPRGCKVVQDGIADAICIFHATRLDNSLLKR